MGTEDKIKLLKQYVEESSAIVFFGGAGVSTESGIPDFRSVDGLYNQKYDYPPETILSHSFYMRKKEEFYRFYRDKMLCLDAKPNAAHKKLAELEAAGKLKAVVTQNIDGLHQAAGSKKVLELHGSILRSYCSVCGKPYPADKMNHGAGVPHCTCGGVIRPDIVLYEEPLDENVVTEAVVWFGEAVPMIETAIDVTSTADIFVVIGTSLNVYPAAGLINYYRGNKLALVNLSSTPYDDRADLVIHEKIGKVFSQL